MNKITDTATNLAKRAYEAWQSYFAGKDGLEWQLAKWASPVVALFVLWFLLWLVVKLGGLIILGAPVAIIGFLIYREVTKKPAA